MPFPGIEKLVSDLEAFDFGKEMDTIVNTYADQLGDLQREQWYEGKDRDGNWIRPLYTEDPFFETPKQALAYAKWKQKITPNPNRPLEVPNLIINGYFYSTIKPKVEGRVFDFDTNEFGDDVLADHPNAAGLDPEKRLEFADTFTMPEIRFSLFEKTGLYITSNE
jgi:hypothetical protein